MKPLLAVEKARDLGIIFSQNDVKMIGQDAAYSIPLHGDESLWIFGDTFIGSFDETGRRLIECIPHNTGLICHPTNAANGLNEFTYLTDADGQLRQLISLMPEEEPEIYRIWAMHGIFLDNRLYLYYIRVRLLPNANWPYKFTVAGSGLAVADYPDLIFQRIHEDNSTILWQNDEPCYGVAVLPVPSDEFVYVYGTELKNGIHQCTLARVPIGKLESISAYQYLSSTKPEWSDRRADVISIMDGMPTEMSVAYNAHLGCYLAVHSRENIGKIVGRTSPTPWGPWSKPVVLWTSKIPLRNPLVYNGPMVYAGKEHPELARDGGKIIYLTCVEFEEYYPRLIEVILK